MEYSSFRVFHRLIEKLEEACMKMHIPLYLNSLGYVENEKTNIWFKRWKMILNSPCIRHFTCRDNLPTFLKLNASVTQVPCIACLVADVLKIKCDGFDNNTIGIGLMRYNCYSDYGKNISKEFLLDYYLNVIIELKRLGYKIALFSTGVQLDHTMGNDIIKIMEQRCGNAKGITLLPRPVEVQDLVKQISHFRGILTVRTHSAYTAFSLNVPTVMMHFGKKGYARKASEFMKMMGRPENAVCCDNLSPVVLVEKFCNAMDAGWDQKVRKERKLICLQNFYTIMDKIGIEASPLDSPLHNMF